MATNINSSTCCEIMIQSILNIVLNTGSYIALATLEFTVYTKLALNSLPLPSKY